MSGLLSRNPAAFWCDCHLSLIIGCDADPADRRRGYAGRRLDAELLFGLGGCGIGFTLRNPALIVTGALVGSSGAILQLHHVQGHEPVVLQRDPRRLRRRKRRAPGLDDGDRTVESGSAEDAAFIMEQAESRHHRSRLRHGGGAGAACAAEMADVLKSKGVKVSYAIHPVAGRCPGI